MLMGVDKANKIHSEFGSLVLGNRVCVFDVSRVLTSYNKGIQNDVKDAIYYMDIYLNSTFDHYVDKEGELELLDYLRLYVATAFLYNIRINDAMYAILYQDRRFLGYINRYNIIVKKFGLGLDSLRMDSEAKEFKDVVLNFDDVCYKSYKVEGVSWVKVKNNLSIKSISKLDEYYNENLAKFILDTKSPLMILDDIFSVSRICWDSELNNALNVRIRNEYSELIKASSASVYNKSMSYLTEASSIYLKDIKDPGFNFDMYSIIFRYNLVDENVKSMVTLEDIYRFVYDIKNYQSTIFTGLASEAKATIDDKTIHFLGTGYAEFEEKEKAKFNVSIGGIAAGDLSAEMVNGIL